MSTYKEWKQNAKNNDNIIKKEAKKEKTEVEIIVDNYLEMLKEDPALLKGRKTTFEHFDALDEIYKGVVYKKIYEVYLKYINDERKKDAMQVRIFTIIESTYNNYMKDLLQKEKQQKCQENGHTWEENWTKTNSGWARKCLMCGKRQTTIIDPNEIIAKTEENKGVSRKRGRRK